MQEARNLLNAGKLVAAVEPYDRWQQSWLKGPEGPPLNQVKEGLLAPTVLFAANYLRALGSIREPSEAEIQAAIDQLVAEPFRAGLKKSPSTSVISRFAEFDDEFRALLSRPEMLDRVGNVARNLPDQDLPHLQGIFRKTLGIEITTPEARKFADEQVQVARMGGHGWKQKLRESTLLSRE